MDCRQTQEFIDAYLDRELDLVHATEVEAHLGQCATCSSIHSSNQQLHNRMQDKSFYFRASANLAQSVRSRLPRPEPLSRQSLVRSAWQRLAFAAMAACALLAVGILVGRHLSRPPAETLLADEIIGAHIRSLLPGHLVDVPSSDQHTVKPWFDGKLDFSPPVPDLAQQGFPLLGGRLDYLAEQPAAALIYQRRKHIINVFVQPSSTAGTTSRARFTRNGYNVIRWEHNGMMFWAVSDVSAVDLEQFAQLFQNH